MRGTVRRRNTQSVNPRKPRDGSPWGPRPACAPRTSRPWAFSRVLTPPRYSPCSPPSSPLLPWRPRPPLPSFEAHLRASAPSRRPPSRRSWPAPGGRSSTPNSGTRSAITSPADGVDGSATLSTSQPDGSRTSFNVRQPAVPDQHLRRQFHPVPPGQRRRDLAGSQLPRTSANPSATSAWAGTARTRRTAD